MPRRPSACQASTSPPRSYKLQEKRGRHGSSYRKIKVTAVGAPARGEPLGPDTLGFDSPSDGADSHPSSQNLCLYRPAILYRPSDHIKACDQTGTPTPNACSLLRYENIRLQGAPPPPLQFLRYRLLNVALPLSELRITRKDSLRPFPVRFPLSLLPSSLPVSLPPFLSETSRESPEDQRSRE